MRKIYQKYFEIPEENKGIMGEHVFFARLAVSIVCIVLCMSAMGVSAYAYFTASVSSNMNQIQAANFDLEVQIEAQTGTSSASCESEKTYKLQQGIYDFVLTKRGNATTGYCQIVVMKDATTEGESVSTRQFGKSKLEESPVDIRTIQIEVEEETIVKFVPCWGTYYVEEKDRFDEQIQKILVKNGMTVELADMPKAQAIGVTNVIAPDIPVVTSEPTTTSTPESTSEPSATITPSTSDVTTTESATSTDTTTATEQETSTEITTPTESADGKNSEEDSES